MKIKITAALLSLAAGIIHGMFIQEHFQEWWGYGSFFLLATIAQVLYAVLLVVPMQKPLDRTLYTSGIFGNLTIIVLWAITRTMGIPFFGPGAGEIEEITFLSVLSVILEIILIGCFLVLLRREKIKA